MSYDSWEEEIGKIGWSFGLSRPKLMLADWRTDRAEWRAELNAARQEIAWLKARMSANGLEQEIEEAKAILRSELDRDFDDADTLRILVVVAVNALHAARHNTSNKQKPR